MERGKEMFKYSWKLYCHRFFQFRTAILFVLLFCAFDLNYAGLDRAVEGLKYPASPWFIISVLTNDFVCASVGLGMVYFFAGTPYLNRNAMYQMIRSGKGKWATAQMLSIVLCSISFTISLFFMGALKQFPKIDWTFSWGHLIHTLAVTDADVKFDVIFDLDYIFMQNMEGWQAALLALVLDSLVFMLIGFLLFSLGLCFGRIPALVVVGSLAVLPFGTQACTLSMLRIFHMISPVSWLRTGLFFTKRIIYEVMPSVTEVFFLMGTYLLITLLLVLVGLHKNCFEWNGEME